MAWTTIKPNHGAALPGRVIVFDCESWPKPLGESVKSWEHVLRLGVAVKYTWRRGKPNGVKSLRFLNSGEFWEFVLEGHKPGQITWLVAHNALFDLRLVDLVDITSGGGWEVDKPRVPKDGQSKSKANRGGRALAILEAPPVVLCLRHIETGCKILCVDTLNWLCVPLATIGDWLNLPKGTMPDWNDRDEAWFDYCDRDVAITSLAFNRLISLVEQKQLGNFARTIAGQAMNGFRHRWMRHKIVKHDIGDVQNLERSGFFGGRSELWRYGEHEASCHQYDVNALYPSVMIDAQLPRQLERFCTDWDTPNLAPNIDPAKSIAEVTLRPKQAVYPYRQDNLTVYPLGEFRTTLCGAELERAWHNGEIVSWHGWAEYQTGLLFRAAMSDLYRWRLEYDERGDKLESAACKLLANSLFGKFGQRGLRWLDEPNMIAPEPWMTWVECHIDDDWETSYRSVGDHVQRQSDEQNTSGAFIAIAAFVTAAAREAMNQLRALAGHANVFYQGTDSLVVNDDGRRRLHAAGRIHATRLGDLKLVKSAARCEIFGIGDYSVGEKVKHTGRRAGDVALGANRWLGTRFMTAAHLFGESKTKGVIVRQFEYEMLRNYKKGKVLNNGQVEPLTIEPDSTGTSAGMAHES